MDAKSDMDTVNVDSSIWYSRPGVLGNAANNLETNVQLPFTVEQFYGVCRAYNDALWPAQVMLVGVAVAAIIFLLRPSRWTSIAVSSILAFLWAWIALAYHLAFFARINPLAYVFSGISLVGAVVFLWQGVVHRRLQFAWGGGPRAAIGAVLVVFALIVYPVWSWYAGHRYPAMPTFGLPCPTTIFTIGLLAFAIPTYPRSPFIVPVLWCFVGAQAAFLLGVPQDLSLIVAGVVGLFLLARSRTSGASGSAVGEAAG